MGARVWNAGQGGLGRARLEECALAAGVLRAGSRDAEQQRAEKEPTGKEGLDKRHGGLTHKKPVSVKSKAAAGWGGGLALPQKQQAGHGGRQGML